jgi:hypothetical protein
MADHREALAIKTWIIRVDDVTVRIEDGDGHLGLIAWQPWSQLIIVIIVTVNGW